MQKRPTNPADEAAEDSYLLRLHRLYSQGCTVKESGTGMIEIIPVPRPLTKPANAKISLSERKNEEIFAFIVKEACKSNHVCQYTLMNLQVSFS